MVFHVYILFCEKDNGLYIGRSSDLSRRIKQHERGEVKSTKHRRPVRLVHSESFLIKKDAMAREKYLKSGYGREQLKSQLKNLFNKLGLK